MSKPELLLAHPAEGVALLTLNRPGARNAIHTPMQRDLDGMLAALRNDDAVRAVVITGAGDAAFSAGYDIRELQGFSPEQTLENYELRRPWVWNVARFPKPLIAAVNGVAHGAGAILAVAMDIRIGSPAAEFRFTAAKYGGVNNTWHLPRLVGASRALDYTMSARPVKADEALQAGLLNRVVPADQVVSAALELAATIAANPPWGVQQHKRLVRENEGREMKAAYDAENDLMAAQFRPASTTELFRGVLPSRETRDP